MICASKELYQYSPHLNVLVIPTDRCNLRCIYCFHQESGYINNCIDENSLLKFITITFPHYKSINIIWHGGEPTSIGVEKFEYFVKLVSEYAKQYNITITQSIQSNGTYLNNEFVEIIKKYDIHIGISYDGPINEITRESTKQFMRAKNLLQSQKISFGAISVVSKLNVNRLIELYNHMKEIGINFQLNHYTNHSLLENDVLRLEPTHYLSKMHELFLYWIDDTTGNINIDPFRRMLREQYNMQPILCTNSSCMRSWCCLRPNGDITSCDKDMPIEYNYGNVNELDDIREIYSSAGYLNLIKKSISRRNKCKSNCDVFDFCQGGCNSTAYVESGLENNGGFSCIVTKGMIHFIQEEIEKRELFTPTPQVSNPVVLKFLKSLNRNK